ncbi:MAG: hypothetical protein IKT39_05625 [Clostridia bacterium]|nr:hypothetical protein [Clostridia bacterium]
MSKKYYFFFIDDIIWLFRDLARQRPAKLFDNAFMKLLKEAHDKYDLKVQLNLFYRTDYYYGWDEFTLAQMPDCYKEEFKAVSDWLKFSFHSKQEFPDYPHVNASYDDMKNCFEAIRNEVFRFAGEECFTYGVVPHWGAVSFDGCRALKDCGVKMIQTNFGPKGEYSGDPDSLPYGHAARLLCNRKPETGIFFRGSKDTAIDNSICAYNHSTDPEFKRTVSGLGSVYDEKTGLYMKFLESMTLNLETAETIRETFEKRADDDLISIGSHEQYFYKDYFNYQPFYSDNLLLMARLLKEAGRECIFIEDLVELGGVTK